MEMRCTNNKNCRSMPLSWHQVKPTYQVEEQWEAKQMVAISGRSAQIMTVVASLVHHVAYLPMAR
eukprot:scaffold587_cov339-Pavlova_lutheri.AAC.42